MAIYKLKTRFFTGAWLTDVKHYFTKINEIIDYLNGNGTSGDGSYKEYVAILNWDNGLDTAVPTVIKNTLGGDIIFTNSGYLLGTLVGGFKPNKTTIFVFGTTSSAGWFFDGSIQNTDNIGIYPYSHDGSLSLPAIEGTSLHIRVYN